MAATTADLFVGLDTSSSETGGREDVGATTVTNEHSGTGASDSGTDASAATGSAARSAGAVHDTGDGGQPTTAAAGAGTAGESVAGAATVKPDVVPHSALHEARSQIRALKETIAKLEAQPKLTAEDSALLTELRAARAAAQNQAPDFLADPKGYVDAGIKAVRDDAAAARKQSEDAKKTTDEHAARAQALQQTAAAEADFLQQHADYPQALEHIRHVQRQQLALVHPEATKDQIEKHIHYVEMQSAMLMLAQGRNPAEYAYAVAKTWGYQAPAAPATQTTVSKQAIDKEAARSLGSGGADGAAGDDADSGDTMPELTAALSERFGARKRK